MTTQEMLDERYGRRRSRRRRVAGWTLVAAVAGALVLGLGWTTVARSLNSVDVDDTGYTVVDEHTVSVSFQVTVSPGAAIACALEAQDAEHGVVGWRIVQYPPSDAHGRSFTETIPTVAAATTGLVNSCWVA